MDFIKKIFEDKARLAIVAIVVLVLLGLIIPSAGGNRFIQNMIVMILIFAGAASAWNLVGGYAGQLSLGHAGFFGIGAYAVVLMSVKGGISPWIGMLAGIAIAMAAAAIIGWPCFRLRGPFFALATIAVGEVLRILAINLPDLTFGSYGVSVNMQFGLQYMLFREKWAYVLMGFIFLAAILLVTWAIERSKLGYYLVAIRENEDAAASLGVNGTKAKLIVFMISAAFTALAGVLYAQYILYIDPQSVFAGSLSVQMVLMTIVGGLGTVWGPVVGSVLLVPLDQFIRAQFSGTVHGLHLVIYSVLLIIVILVIPKGIVPTVSDWLKARDAERRKRLAGGGVKQ